MYTHLFKHHDDEELYQFALYVTSSISVLPAALKAAVQLGVFKIIAETGPGGRLSPAEIASHLPSQSPNSAATLHRILRVLASHSILECSSSLEGEAKYSLMPVCKFLLEDEDGVSLDAWPLMVHNKVTLESWGCIKDVVLEGGVPFQKAHSMPYYELQGVNPEFNVIFGKAMAGQSTMVVKKILNTYKGFEGLDELMDVGGGIGYTINLIVSKYPQIKATNFDLKHVIDTAPNYPGVKHVSGNMFEKIPSSTNIFMKCVLHNWSDESCIKLLKNCYTSLPESGKLIIVDLILSEKVDDDLKAKNVFACDFAMLSLFPNARERTLKELKELAKAGGFSRFEPVCCVYGFWVMEFYK